VGVKLPESSESEYEKDEAIQAVIDLIAELRMTQTAYVSSSNIAFLD
jgi:hypothetical protein